MPKTGRCPDCGAKRAEHLTFAPDPSEWSETDFINVVENEGRVNPNVPEDKAWWYVAPQLLWELTCHGLRDDVLGRLVFLAWSQCQAPLLRLERSRWVSLFERVGYREIDAARVDDGLVIREHRPSSVPRLYRGAGPDGTAPGLSWTPSRWAAEAFARNRAESTGFATYLHEVTDVSAERVLGRVFMNALGNAEEWIVDVEGLEVTRAPIEPLSCGCSSHWGDLGAAGLALGRLKNGRITRVLLQKRGELSHHGGTWGLPGGALEPGEDDRTAALREVVEETGIDVAAIDVVGECRDEHDDWHYTTVVAITDRKLATNTDSPETEECRWVRLEDVEGMELQPGFATSWPEVRGRLLLEGKAALCQ